MESFIFIYINLLKILILWCLWYIIIIFELILLQNFLILFQKKIFNNSNKINDIKQNLIKELYNNTKKNFTHINVLYISGNGSRLGNFFICVNNAIIFCEFLNCKKIIIDSNKYLFINLIKMKKIICSL